MKRMMFLLVISLALMVGSALAQTGVVTGKVVDGDTKTPLAGVGIAALSGKKWLLPPNLRQMVATPFR